MSEKEKQAEDYVSLNAIKTTFLSLLKGCFKLISFLGFTIRKNLVLISTFSIIGALLGYGYYLTKPSYYKVSMVVQFNELTKKSYAEMFLQLNKLATSKSVGRLAKELNIPEDAASEILFLDTKDMNDAPLEKDTSTKVGQPFKILAGLKNNNKSDTIQNAIIDYLNNSPLLKNYSEELRKIFLDKLDFVEKEQRKIDSLKDEYNKFLSSSKISATFYNNAFNPADLYVQSYSLANEKERLLRWLNIDSQAVRVIDGFKITNTPQSSSLIKYILIFGGGFLIITFLISLYKETRKKLLGF